MYRPATVEVLSYDVNTGTSFMDKTCTLGGLSPYLSNIEDSRYHIDYLHGKSCIDTGLENPIPLTPRDDNKVIYTVEIVDMAKIVNQVNGMYGNKNNDIKSLFGLYVKELEINPEYGRGLINFLANTNTLKYVWDYIEDNIDAHNSTEDDFSFNISLPMDISFLIDTKSSIKDYLIEIKFNTFKGSFFSKKSTLLKYRNFDMYISDYKYVNGYIANLTPLSKDIERFYVITSEAYCTMNPLPSNQVLPNKELNGVAITNQYAYSGETYELKTPTALILGKVNDKILTVVNDVLGRISTRNPVYDTPCKNTSIINYLYSSLLNLVGFGLEEISNYRTDIALNDTDNARNIMYFLNESDFFGKDKYLTAMFNLNREQLTFAYEGSHYLGVQPQFSSLLERINLIREAVCLSLPNQNMYDRFKYFDAPFNSISGFKINNREIPEKSSRCELMPVYCGNPVRVKMVDNDFLCLSSYLPERMIKSEYLTLFENLYENRNIAYTEVTNPLQTNLKGSIRLTSRYGTDYELWGYEEVGIYFNIYFPDIKILNLSSDFRQLKNLVRPSIELDEFVVDISKHIDFEVKSKSRFKDDGKNSNKYILPENWREIQIPKVGTSVSKVNRLYHMYYNSSKLNIGLTNSSDYEPSSIKILLGNNYIDTVADRKSNEDTFLSYTLASDPFLSIRNQVNNDQSVLERYNKSQTGVQGFGDTNHTEQQDEINLSKEILGLQPITNYGLFTINQDNKKELVVPMLGTLCKITNGDVKIDEHLLSNINFANPFNMSYDSTTQLVNKRRYDL